MEHMLVARFSDRCWVNRLEPIGLCAQGIWLLMMKRQGNKLWGSIAVIDYTGAQTKKRKVARSTQQSTNVE